MDDMNNPTPQALGISGRIAALFQSAQITPLLALVAFLLGVFAVMVTPREEEPQINVTMANVLIPFPGASVTDVEQMVATPAEQVLSQMAGTEHVMSISRPGVAVLTVQFKVGVERTEALVRLHDTLRSNTDWLPRDLGVLEPIIKPKGIDDVPIVTLTLFSKNADTGAFALERVAHSMEAEIKRVAGTREVQTVGGPGRAVMVRLDPARMASTGTTVQDLRSALQSANMGMPVGELISGNQAVAVEAGPFLMQASDVAELMVGVRGGKPLFLKDVAEVSDGPLPPSRYVWHGKAEANGGGEYPAVTLLVTKKPGENAIDVANAVMQRVEQLRNTVIPDGVEVAETRNYGATANDKAQKLIQKLLFATASVVALVFIALGRREAAIVGTAVVLTLTVTLFASWAWGFTLNRVSLFALIFSIGILVDDAIVVVENIHRHQQLFPGKTLAQIIPGAVDEVGGPTILATFTVIAALLPMAFVSGLMGPYMSPIPINASMGMLISLVVAFVVTPWLSHKLLKHNDQHDTAQASHEDEAETKMVRLFTHLIGPFLLGKNARKARVGLAAGVFVLIGIAVALPVGQLVVLKMLPFDNKSEFQVMVDMPEGTPVEQTQRVLQDLSRYLTTVPEVEHLQLYAGTNAPMNFNGLVRHYFLRHSQELGDIQVNLVDKKHRKRDSHSIAVSVRDELQQIGEQYQANIKVVEVPPGPPVWSPLVAEVYGPSPAIREQAAYEMQALFHETKDVVDIDIFLPAAQQKWQVMIDRSKASLMAVPYSNIVDLIATSVGGKDVSYLHQAQQKQPIPIRLQLNEGAKVDLEQVLNMKLLSQTGQSVPVSELVTIKRGKIDAPIIHKNMIPMIMVVADMSGPLDSPLYGMFDMAGKIDGTDGLGFDQHYIHQPTGLDSVAVLWDGEWKITYETFRDMGIAYAVGMIAIYLLVVAQFRSYLVPLIIMAPIPLTVIGVMPGHALLGAQFTATSMIGMIALAGIIVRNSILLVDFINQETASGVPFERAVIHSGAVRAKPIMLTAFAAMIGALFILDDPIFNGLAISLIFGIFISTILTLVVIPVLYYTAMKNRMNTVQI